MRIKATECMEQIEIGKVGENIVTEVLFSEYEGFPASLTYLRPGADEPYPVLLTETEGGWLWTVTSTDLANAGWGRAEVVYTEGEAVKLSRTWRVVVKSSLEPAGAVPEPWESYYEEIIAAGNTAAQKATEAAQSASSAATSAENAEQSAESADGSALRASESAEEAEASATEAEGNAREAYNSATNAADSAELAEGFKTVAQTAATEALTSATNAAQSAREAAASASAAQASAEQAAQIAQSIEGALDDYSTTAEMTAAISAAEGRAKAYTDEAVADIDLSAYSTTTEMQAAIADGVTEAKTYTDESIIKLLPTDTASGAVASFPDGANDVPMISLNVAVEPVQDLHGYDSPWPAGGRGNLAAPYSEASYYHNGVTYTNNNGVYHMEGTASPARSALDVPISISPGDYVLSAFNDAAVATSIYLMRGPTVIVNLSLSTANASIAFTLSEPLTNMRLTLANAYTADIDVYPMITPGTIAPTAWFPYENICPISGWSAAGVNVNGETITHEFKDAQGNTLTVYGGEDELVGGKLKVTRGVIDSYAGESIGEPWISSIDAYTPGGTPTTGAQVVYTLAVPREYNLPPVEVHTLYGDNTIFADCGNVSVTYRADVQKWVEKKLGS